MLISQVFQEEKLPVSFEIFPPKGEMPLDKARELMGALKPLQPSFMSVTCSAGGSGNSSRTVDVAAMALQEFGIEPVMHLTCMGATEDDIDASLAAARDAGIQNILALRGDPISGRGTVSFEYAKDLIPHVAAQGFCVGAAAYPEGHIDCLDFATSIEHLKQKQDAGASFFVTQLFFDNEQGLRFLDAAHAKGIDVPITMGIMPFLSKDQISRMVFMCGASLPSPVIKLLARWEDDPVSLRKAGIDYACNQLVGLAQAGVDGLHVYTMNSADIAAAAIDALAPYR